MQETTAKLSDWFVFTSRMNKTPIRNRSKDAFKVMLIGVVIFSGVRQILRNRVSGDTEESISDQLDLVNVVITIVLSCSFYLLLYFAYLFAYRGTEEKDTTIVLRSVALVGQFAIIRDILFAIYAILEYRMEIFRSGAELEDRVYLVIFFSLDAILWILTIIYLMPLVIARLQSDDTIPQQSFITPFLLSTIIFWITWVFNYVLLRIFVELPLGRELF